MVSIENLYWIIQANLLEPVGLDCWYYYPFGTTDNISYSGEFQPQAKKDRFDHVLFHFDQEPIYENYLGANYDIILFNKSQSSKIFRGLANSEHSEIKQEICRQRGLMDWYFFYHGLAALHWFWDAKYVHEVTSIETPFCSFAHLVNNKRAYRMALLARFKDRGLLAHGDVSFHGDAHQCQAEIQDTNTKLSTQDRDLIQRHLCGSPDLPLILDHYQVDGGFSARFGHQEYKLWQRSLLHVVNETVFYDRKLHLTEKVFKPIVALRPFVLVSAPGNLQYLRGYGFKTFGDWIDESYDTVDDDNQRLDLITREVDKICKKSHTERIEIYKDMKAVLEHNKRHFFGRFREIIVDELIENFDTCVRVWNNGRVDGKELRRHPDLESVRHLLLG